MIRFIFPFLFLSLCFTNAISQIHFGVKGGLVISRIVKSEEYYSNLSDHASTLLGPQVGFFTRFKLSTSFSLNPEVQFIQKGYKTTYTGTNSKDKKIIDYLEFPLMVGYSFFKKFNVEVGPTVAFKFYTEGNSDGSIYEANEDNYKFVDFGFTGGLRYDITKKIAVSGRYYCGLTTLSEAFFDFHNHNIQTSVYYTIR